MAMYRDEVTSWTAFIKERGLAEKVFFCRT